MALSPYQRAVLLAEQREIPLTDAILELERTEQDQTRYGNDVAAIVSARESRGESLPVDASTIGAQLRAEYGNERRGVGPRPSYSLQTGEGLVGRALELSGDNGQLSDSVLERVSDIGDRVIPPERRAPDDSWRTTARKMVQNYDDSLGTTVGGLLQAPRKILEGVFESLPGMGLVYALRDEAMSDEQKAAEDEAWAPIEEPLKRAGRGIYERASAELQRNAPNLANSPGKRFVYDLGTVIADLATATAASVVTRSPRVGQALIGARVFGSKYGESIAAGRTEDEAFQDASVHAVAEVIGEGAVIRRFMAPGQKFGKRVAQGAVGEAVQESITSLIQNGYDVGIIGEDTTFGEFMAHVGYDALLGAAGGGTIAAAVHPFTRRAPDQVGFDPSDSPVARPDGLADAARGAPVPVTPEDEASPLPTDRIARGRQRIEAAAGAKTANQILQTNAAPEIGSRVEIIIGGEAKQGVIEDAFTREDGDGIKVKLDDGSTFDEYFDNIRDANVAIVPLERAERAHVAPEAVPETPEPGQLPKGLSQDAAIRFIIRRLEGGGERVVDTGGVTRYGISKNANPDVDVENLTEEQAIRLYKERYWGKVGLDDSTPPDFALVALDAAIHHGQGAARKMVAEAKGDTAKLLALRRAAYAGLIRDNPNKYGKYERGWENRLKTLEGALGGALSTGETVAGEAPTAPDTSWIDEIMREDGALAPTLAAPVQQSDRLREKMAFDPKRLTISEEDDGSFDARYIGADGLRLRAEFTIKPDGTAVIDVPSPNGRKEAGPTLIRQISREIQARYPQITAFASPPGRRISGAAGRNRARTAFAPIAPGEGTRISPVETPARLFHGSTRDDLTIEGIEIVSDRKTKQGKRNKYGGFYATEKAEEAEGYASMMDGKPTVYEIDLKPNAVIEDRDADITRLSEQEIAGYRARGVDVVRGKDVRGRTEYAVINRDAIERMGKAGQAASPVEARTAEDVAVDTTRADVQDFGRALDIEGASARKGAQVMSPGTSASEPGGVEKSATGRGSGPTPGAPVAFSEAAGDASIPEPAFDPAAHVEKLRSIVADTKVNLNDPAKLAKAMGLKPAEANAVMGTLASRPGAGFFQTKGRPARYRTVKTGGGLKKGTKRVKIADAVPARWQRLSTAKGPMDVIAFARSLGGVQNTGGHDLRNVGAIANRPGLISSRGLTLDELGEALADAGYFAERPDVDEVIQLLDRASIAKVFRPEDEATAREKGLVEQEGRERAEAREKLGAALKDPALKPFLPSIIAESDKRGIVELMMDESDATTRDDPYSATAEYFSRRGADTLDALAEETADDFYSMEDVPFEEPSREAEQREDEGDGREAAAGRSGPAREREDAAGGEEARADSGEAEQQIDAFGERAEDKRKALERRAEGRKRSDRQQKPPGSEGGLFDQRDTQLDIESDAIAQARAALQTAMTALDQAAAPEEYREIGVTNEGFPLFERPDGLRYYLRNGQKFAKRLELMPPPSGDRFDRTSEFLTKEEFAEKAQRVAAKRADELMEQPKFSRISEESPVFYSALERAVEASPTKRAPASQWIATLAKTPGVKREELEWSGVFDWLDAVEGPVERDVLLQVIRDGGIKVEEVILSASPSERDGGGALYIDPADEGGFDVRFASPSEENFLAHFETEAEASDYVRNRQPTQFSDWSSDPSNPTYRELLITLPLGEGGNPSRAPATHWDTDSVVAHARFMEKTDAEGKRVLFIEEVQSDWHQKGRDEGYERTVDPAEVAAREKDSARAEQAFLDAAAEVERVVLGAGRGLPGNTGSENVEVADRLATSGLYNMGDVPGFAEADKALVAARLAWIEARSNAARARSPSGIPDAPFKSSWPALVLKRMVRYAADNGFEKIAWTTGIEQAERYNLSQAVGLLSAAREADGRLKVIVGNSQARNTIRQQYGLSYQSGQATSDALLLTDEKATEIFGADIARRLAERADAAGGEYGAPLEGDDLRVGGEGMKAFYDRNLVNIANDILKKFGVKVGPIRIPTRAEYGSPRFQAEAHLQAASQSKRVVDALGGEEGVRRKIRELEKSDGEVRIGPALHDANSLAAILEIGDWKNVDELRRAVERTPPYPTNPGFDLTPALIEAARGGFPLFRRENGVIAPVDAETAAGWRDKLQAEMKRLGIDDRILLEVVGKSEFGDKVAGSYWRRTITVALDVARDPLAIMSHESVHALKELGLFRPSEWTAMAKAVDGATMADVVRRYPDLTRDQQIEEAIADSYGRWRSDRAQAKGFVAKAFQRISDLFQAIQAAFRTTPGQVFRDIESGKVGRRTGIAGDSQGPLFSREDSPQPIRVIKKNAFPDASVEATFLIERKQGPPWPKGMKIGDYDLFWRKVLVDDLQGQDELPFGFTPETLSEAKRHTDKLVSGNEIVQAAARRYSFARMLDAQVEGVTPGDITEAQRGEESLAANIRIDKLESTQDIGAALEVIAERFEGFEDSRRGVVSHEETAALAEALDMTTGQLLARRKGEAFNAHELLAARQLLVASADNLVELAAKAEGGSDTDLVDFRRAWIRHVAIQEQVSGMTAEAGRALNQFKLLARSGGDLNARMMREVINVEGGREDVENVAKAILGFANDPAKMNRFARDAYKPTWRDKLFELWINGLLSGPATHVVNAVSNTMTGLTQLPEYAAAAGIGKLRSLRDGDTDRILRSEIGARVTGMVHGARESAKLAAEAMRTGEGSDLMSKMEARTQRAISGRKGEIVRIPGRLLIASDEFFKGTARRMEITALATRQATKEGLTGDEFKARVADLTSAPTEEMVDASMEFARYSTFTRPLGPMGQAITNVINAIPGMRMIVPFIRTPANIFKFAIARTPAAPILREVREDFQAGGIARDLAIARVILGSSLGATVMLLAAAGIITGGDPEDESARKLLRANGWQPYSVKIGDTYYSYQRLDPLATILGVAADLAGTHEHMSEEERENAYSSMFMSLMNQLKNKTFLSGIGSLIEAIEDPGRFGPSFIGRLAGTVIPTGVAQINNQIDPVIRDVRGPLQRIQSRVPGLSDNLLPKRDIWGQPIVREGGVGPDFASPFWTTADRDDPVAIALLNLGVDIDVPSRKISGFELTPEQYDAYSELAGQYLRAGSERLVASRAWEVKDDEDRREAFDSVKGKARKRARQELGLTKKKLERQALAEAE